MPFLTKKPHMGAKELQNTLQEQHNCTISYDTVWKGKEKALRELYGTWEDSFKLLFRWREAVLEVMPDSANVCVAVCISEPVVCMCINCLLFAVN
jgi:hypothetical protein